MFEEKQYQQEKLFLFAFFSLKPARGISSMDFWTQCYETFYTFDITCLVIISTLV